MAFASKECNIHNNKGNGAGIYNDGGNCTLNNCNITYNEAGWIGGGIYSSKRKYHIDRINEIENNQPDNIHFRNTWRLNW